jgi:DnaJ like chaperone protein
LSWWGKVLGGAFGFAAGGPLGALLGVAVGHHFDRGLEAGPAPLGHEREPTMEDLQTAFFTAVFSIMGHLCKADGHISPAEIAMAESLMNRMNLGPEQRRAAIGLFNQGKAADFPFDAVLAQFRREVGRQRDVARFFLEILFQAGYADGELGAAERAVLYEVGRQLEFGTLELAAIELRARPAPRGRQAPPQQSLDAAYATLGVPRTATNDEVKRAYRRLLSQHHPDKLVGAGVPEEMIALANEKTHQIKEAYRRVMEARGA